MKSLVLFSFFCTAVIHGQTCANIDTGSSLYGHHSWHGYVAGSPSSTYNQNITSAPVDPHSSTWLTTLAGTAQMQIMGNPVYITDGFGQGWDGFSIHYIHGNTQRRTVVRDNPAWSSTSVSGAMTAGSNTLTITSFSLPQGRRKPYFIASDAGMPVSVSGACSGSSSTCLNGVLGANPGTVTIASVQGPTQVTLSTAASATVTGATIKLQSREDYPGDSDPGTFPIPLAARIQSFYGIAHSRPFSGIFLDSYLDPLVPGTAESDQHIFVVDVDNCVGYELYKCFDDFSSYSCGAYSAFYLPGGDLQRPYNMTGGASVSGLSLIRGMLRYDEFASGTIPHALNMTALNLSVPAFTGAAEHGQCCGPWDGTHPPFGAKLRLKADFDSSGYPGSCAPLLTEMKTYGLIVVDGGYTGQLFQTTSNSWPFDCAYYMYSHKFINPANFDIVKQAETHIYCASGQPGCPDAIPTGNPPAITGFTVNGSASANITLGDSATLAWNVSGVVDFDGNPVPMRNISWGPSNKLGPGWVNSALHGEGLTIVTGPGKDIQSAGTYNIQLMVQNRFGRTMKTVKIVVK